MSRWRMFLPLLDIYISVPLLTIRTALMTERIESATTEYIVLDCRLYKWRFGIRLYDTMRRQRDREFEPAQRTQKRI